MQSDAYAPKIYDEKPPSIENMLDEEFLEELTPKSKGEFLKNDDEK